MNLKLKARRVENNLTQKGLVDALREKENLDISQSSYSKKEQGKAEFTLREAKALSKVLNSDLQELF